MRNFRSIVTLTLLAMVGIGRSAPAQEAPRGAGGGGNRPEGAATIPDSPVGRAAHALLDAINGSDEKAIARFCETTLSSELFHGGGTGWTPERYAAMFQRLRAQSGGLEPVRVLQDANEAHLAVVFRTKTGDHMVGLEFVESPKEAGRLSLIEPHPFKGAGNRPLPWPEGKLDESGITKAIEEHVRKVVERDLCSGVVLVAKGDRVLLHRAYGMADREHSAPNTLSTRFNIASIGKMFTAVAIGQLVEQGKLRFDDRLADVLPDYPNKEAARRLTIHHLLTHTSGLGDPFASARRDPKASYNTPWENIALFADQPLAFEPGAKHDYSNGNYAVLGAVIEKLSGQKYHEYISEHVFRTAGMRAADPEAYEVLPWAIGYTHLPERDPLGIEPRSPAETSSEAPPAPGQTGGFGGDYLTAEDLFRFLRALKGHRLLSAEMTETLTQGKVDVMPGVPVRYGYGFYEHIMDGTRVRGHSGGGGNSGIGGDAELIWDKDYTVIVLENHDLDEVRPLSMSITFFLSKQEPR